MKIYLVKGACGGDYKNFSATGTWTPGSLCPKCQYSTEILVPPLLVEWDKEGSILSEFSWSSYDCIVREDFGAKLINLGLQIDLCDTIEAPIKTKRLREKIEFMKSGCNYYWLRPKNTVPVDMIKSGLEIKVNCDKCNRIMWHFKMHDLNVAKLSLGDTNIFGIEQYKSSSAFYVTEKGRAIIESLKPLNVEFLEVGSVG